MSTETNPRPSAFGEIQRINNLRRFLIWLGFRKPPEQGIASATGLRSSITSGK